MQSPFYRRHRNEPMLILSSHLNLQESIRERREKQINLQESMWERERGERSKGIEIDREKI